MAFFKCFSVLDGKIMKRKNIRKVQKSQERKVKNIGKSHETETKRPGKYGFWASVIRSLGLVLLAFLSTMCIDLVIVVNTRKKHHQNQQQKS